MLICKIIKLFNKYCYNKYHFLSTSIFLIFLSFASQCEIFAEISPKDYLFSNLLASADAVVTGKVNSVQSDDNKYEMIFEVEDNLSNDVSQKQINIISKITNGFRLAEEPYLETGKKYLLFLKKGEHYYSIVNRLAGVLNVSVKDDVVKILNAYKQNKLLFSDKNTNEKIELFDLLYDNDIKTRLLYDMEEGLTENHISFIRSLIMSDIKRNKIFGLKVLANIKGSTEIEKVEELLLSSDEDMQFHSVVTLGNIGNKETITKLIPFLKSTEQPLRRVAIEAISKIDIDIAFESLREIYEKEVDFGNRVAIIEAVKKAEDKNKLKNVLSYFLTIEYEEFVKKIIEKYSDN